MSESAFVVVPIQTGGAKQSEKNPAELASVLQQTINKSRSSDEEQRGPLKELIAHKDSLYQYINWEDPVRTLGAYFSALTVLFGLHYLPLTQLAVKAGAVILGTIFLTEFISRQFGSDTFLLRLRPKEYKTVPEPTLNATLKDIHAFVQYAVVQFQKIIYGEDLGKTFAAFLSCITVYWLMKVASPFLLAVLGLTSVYIAPLVNSSHGRAVAQDAASRGKDLANTAAGKGKTLAEDGKSRAAELSSKARETTQGVQQHFGNLTESAESTANDISGQATAEDSGKLRDIVVDAISKAPDIAKPSFDDARQDNSRTYSSILSGGAGDYIYDTDGVTKNVSQSLESTSDVPRRMASHSNTINTIHHPNSALDNRERIVSFR
ncbi:Reticulon-domain-containing protein [Fusarium flagelliforme]|uniref:Reticulon-domain-containing protein n=1 Tax=Fusarium flagelliforme TaxID=2675880 RepID=UPI001E8D93A9|nr:Reticulon-domain-containing protein [Fusarium flagelliforme]KAH7173240.1 Reticulon-domain-containing protein [Fusarium flagelliforme]